MSQEALAREMVKRGFPWFQSTVYKVEHSGRRMEMYEGRAVCDILGISVDRLFWAGDEAAEMALVEGAISSLRQAHDETARAVARLDAAARAAARTLRDRGGSRYERVRETCGDLEAELGSSTLDLAVARAGEILDGDS